MDTGDLTRRGFLRKTVPLVCLGGMSSVPGSASPDDEKAGGPDGKTSFGLHPIGTVEKGEASQRIRLFEEFTDGLLGLENWSHVNVFYWFDKNDTPVKRGILRVHPRGDKQNPLTGVFACRAPVRPNLIALCACEILSVESDGLVVKGLDAFDGTPVIDLKPLIPPDAPTKGLRVPDWARKKKKKE